MLEIFVGIIVFLLLLILFPKAITITLIILLAAIPKMLFGAIEGKADADKPVIEIFWILIIILILYYRYYKRNKNKTTKNKISVVDILLIVFLLLLLISIFTVPILSGFADELR